MLQAGLSREVITPARGVPLCGYFNPRPNTGILDDLFVRTLLLKKEGVVAGLVVFDLCFISAELVEEMKSRIKAAGLKFAGNLIFSATHTHTGPYTDKLFKVKPDARYLAFLVDRAVSSVERAWANLAPAELLVASVNRNPLGFNRRYWMKSGKVVTNPGKLNPDIVKVEGPVDRQIGVLAVRQDGRISAVLANIVNHTDTVDGNFVSGDWPGRMECAIQDAMGYEVPVLTLIGCSGNVNHVDVTNQDPWYGYDVATHIGTGYAEIVTGLLKKLKKLPVKKITVRSSRINIPFRVLPDAQVQAARATIARIGNAAARKNMTSEGLATGDGPVAKFFAQQVVDFQKECSGKARDFTLVSIGFDDRMAISSLPGEPFTEIGLELKKRSPYAHTWLVTLAMGECGYIPLPECFARGGYETLPVVGGGPREDTCERITRAAAALLDRRAK